MLRVFLFAMVVMSFGAPALAHDPLQHDRHIEKHQDDGPLQRPAAASTLDLAVARSLLISFRETGDDHNLDKAWLLLEPTIESGAASGETLVVAAFVAQSLHDFTAAEQLITRALEFNPGNDEAWLLLASIHLVRGESESAAAACARLRNVPPLVLLTCKARVALVRGEHALALPRLIGVLNIADTGQTPADLLAWSYSVAGDLAVAGGHPQQAEDLYRHSLALAERSQVRAALVDVLLTDGDNDGAWQALDAGAPSLPLLVRRFIAAKRLNRLHELEPEWAKVRQEFDAWIANEDWLHAREMTRFYIDVVDRPVVARRLALINIGLQREPEDLRLELRTRHEACRFLLSVCTSIVGSTGLWIPTRPESLSNALQI